MQESDKIANIQIGMAPAPILLTTIECSEKREIYAIARELFIHLELSPSGAFDHAENFMNTAKERGYFS